MHHSIKHTAVKMPTPGSARLVAEMIVPEMTADRSSQELWVCHLGTVPYREALAMQDSIRARRQSGELPDTLVLLEHPPVYTRGRRSSDGDLPFAEDFYLAKGIDVIDTDRGGQLTYHGPGQLIGYPIMGVGDVHSFLRTMEDAIVAALAEEGVQGRSRHQEGIDYTGVWVQDRKIASIGVHVSRGISTHGFAVNVDNDLDPFNWVVACGLPDVTMTSMQRELAPTSSTGMDCMRRRVAFQFCEAHGRRQRLVSPRRLGIDTANAAGLAAERAPISTSQPAPAEAVPA
jgi:lipoyl(octanoyl) transferase